jgi:hypothetical protein
MFSNPGNQKADISTRLHYYLTITRRPSDPAKMSLKFHDAVRDKILTAVHQRRFEDGAFIPLISRLTPVADVMRILIASPLLSESVRWRAKEKEVG